MITLSPQQEIAFKYIKEFVETPTVPVFILKGYAGTGKTTMIRSIIPTIQSMGKSVMLMAPTGRAAKVLSEKTDYMASTIHSAIYEMDHLSEAGHDKDDYLEFFFGIRSLPKGVTPDRLVCIIDESSMISSRKNSGEIIHFGTDVLLDDLFTFGNPHEGAKFIFIGDPVQLPPVGDNRSAALDEPYFLEMGLKTMSYELTDVLRQTAGSAILSNAMRVRDLFNTTERSELAFDRVDGEVVDITPQRITDSFVKNHPQPQLGSSVVICYSNSMVREYNESIRREYFSDTSRPQVGDVIQIVKNNYKYGLYNGDFAQIVSLAENVEKQAAPVWATFGNERKTVNVELEFRDISLITYDGRTVNCKIVETLLGNHHPGLTPMETKSLYINYRIRHPELKTSESISQGLKDDPYFNALCVKYGYAITCHKAQGGEWPTVYVDYHYRTGLDNDSLRWIYTATTRASKHLFGVLMPNIQLFDKLKVNPIQKESKPAKNALSVKDCGFIPALPASASNAQKAKYISAEKALSLLACKVSRVEFFSYVDRYYIDTPDGERVYDIQYNGSGIYVSAKPLNNFTRDEQIVEALMSDSEYIYDIHFSTDSASLNKLHTHMQSICDELNITITNVTEASYQIVFHLKTSGKYSTIAFFYNNKKEITYAAPSSDLGSEDEKLSMLVERLKL